MTEADGRTHRSNCNAIYAVYRTERGCVNQLINFYASKETAIGSATNLLSERNEEEKKNIFYAFEPMDATPEICRMLKAGGLLQ
ncbi:MAG: hypothetical protein LBH25_04715 [Fibromonadaceae bacterium]|nr:hypothetical protein [Fibromonadaceae bacterium]